MTSPAILREDAIRVMTRSLRDIPDIQAMMEDGARLARYRQAGASEDEIREYDLRAAGIEIIRRALFGEIVRLSGPRREVPSFGVTLPSPDVQPPFDIRTSA